MKKFLTGLVVVLALFGGVSQAQAQIHQSIQVGDGSCASPAITFINDTNTGIIRLSADTIGICVGGVQVMTINSSGAAILAGNVKIDQNKGEVTAEGSHSTTGSAQAIAGDKTLSGTGLGHVGGYLGGVMGNVIGGSDVTAAGNNASNTFGLLGKYTVDPSASYTPGYPRAGVIGECAGGCDASIVASMSGSDFPTIGARRAYFAVDSQLIAGGSGGTVQFGLDLQGPGAHDVYGAVAYSVAPIRLLNDTCILVGTGVPVDGTTGAGHCGKGSLFINDSGSMYSNSTGTKASPIWTSRW